MKLSTPWLFALALLVPGLAAAQPSSSTPSRDRARTFLVLRLADELGLSDEKALQVSGIMRRGQDKRRELATQRDEVEKQLRAALDKSPPDEAALTKLIAQANDIDQQSAEILESTFKEIQKSLTVEQQAKLVLFRPELRKQVRGALRNRMHPGEAPGPRGPGGRGRGQGPGVGGQGPENDD